ncbi:uncharacterized protein N7443_007848 [Penicillium atrosanguineum]|uniref:uncharacterized protein n=1 Tax=Penicillium atrosanguineum TaxID=1132637 RepID=UPI00239AA523|nr:uncharacterized protein N7443_007848 [Penicillium atrosanguineum]KAJ5296955.1 hypothetical protein N7443_007848 [Penicillium atrosanguineum]
MVGSAMEEDTLLARVNVMVSLCTKKLDQYSNRDHTIITCANEVNTLAALKSTMMHRDILPPGKRNMDDTFVYAVKQLETQASCKKYEGVFDGNGHLHIDRKPSGNSVVVPAFGVKWLLFMGGRCILTGSALSQRFLWIMGQNRVPVLRGRGLSQKLKVFTRPFSRDSASLHGISRDTLQHAQRNCPIL